MKMENKVPRQSITSIIQEKINISREWVKQCSVLTTHIAGMDKLIRKLNAEISFLTTLQLQDNVDIEQVKSSNVTHLQAVAHTALTVPGVVAVLQPMTYRDVCDSTKKRIVVDVIGHHRNMWIKVVARNERSLGQIFLGEGPFGQRTIVDHANDYITTSEQNLNYYKVPSIQFNFYKGVTEDLCRKLEEMNITVKKCRETSLYEPIETQQNHSTFDLPQRSEIRQVNLDVSCMIAYVSSMTNGNCNFVFKEDILTAQALRETTNPVKPLLDAWFEGRQLLSCETAISDFKKIVNIIGGQHEKESAQKLLQRVTVVKDCIPQHFTTVHLNGQIKKRSLVIFGTGESLKIATVTANAGFVRAAQSQGFNITAIVHESRALSEEKEKTAVKVNV